MLEPAPSDPENLVPLTKKAHQTPKEGPNLNKLSMIDGEGHRQKIYPAAHQGRFTFHRRWTRWVLLAFGLVLPWFSLAGKQAVLLDIPGRQFRFLWLHLNAQDVPLFFFALTGVGFTLFVTSAMFGRVFCGWVCPHTVVLEGLFRPIERLIEGEGNVARRFDAAPWTGKKVALKALKWTLFLAIAFVLAHTFLAYFVGGKTLVSWMVDSPKEHWTVFLWAAAATGLMLFNFGWFREQLCLIICPYGRMQSALQDDDTVVVGYDTVRGEPRGKAKDPNAGACVDCRRCVAVCPTGIDIRNGMQMECIGCAACIDACDDVMDRLGRDRGLIRYDSQNSLFGRASRFLRPRLAYYAVAGFLGLGVATTFIGQRVDIEANVVRIQGAPYEIVEDGVFNRVMVHVVNKDDKARTFRLDSSKTTVPLRVQLPVPSFTIPPLGDARIPIIIQAPRGVDVSSPATVELWEQEALRKVLDVRFLSPNEDKQRSRASFEEARSK